MEGKIKIQSLFSRAKCFYIFNFKIKEKNMTVTME